MDDAIQTTSDQNQSKETDATISEMLSNLKETLETETDKIIYDMANEVSIEEFLKTYKRYMEECIFQYNRDNPIPIRYFVNDKNPFELETRLPNEHEKREFLIYELALMRIMKYINTVQYRTVKGQIRRGFYDIGLNFIAKRGRESIREEFEVFCETEKEILTMKIQIQPTTPITMASIDIDITNPGGK